MKDSIAIIRIFNETSSHSANSIEEALIKIYEAETNSTIFLLNSNATDFPAIFVSEIHSFDKIIFPSFHLPSPELLENLSQLSNGSTRPVLVFHLYGNFFESIPSWQKLCGPLMGFKVKFYTPSNVHANFVSQFLKDPEIVDVLRPGLLPEFFYSDVIRNQMRERLGVREDEKIYIYTGRLTFQKQITTLIAAWSKVAAEQRNVRLLLVGNFDDLSDPIFGEYFLYGYYENIIYHEVNSLEKEVRQRLKFISYQTPAVINKLLCAADVFVTFSLHHDEDYCLSVHEALQTGLPIIATQWGGLKDYRPFGTTFLPVENSGHMRRISAEKAADILQDEARKQNCLDRPEKALAFSEQMKARTLLQKGNEKKIHLFSGFNDSFTEAGLKLINNSPGPFISDSDLDFYRKIYKHYWP